MGGLGRLLDKGINRLISGDLPPSGPPSTGSDADPFSRQLSRPADPGSPTVSFTTPCPCRPQHDPIILVRMSVWKHSAGYMCQAKHSQCSSVAEAQRCGDWLQHRRSSSLQSNGGIAPVASFKDLASASQQAFAQGGTPAHQSKPGGSPTQQVPIACLCLPATLTAMCCQQGAHAWILWPDLARYSLP